MTDLSDFPDRLPPMLVKELRQGLRAKTFVAVFLAFQGMLALILLSATASGGSGNVGTVISVVIFTFFGIAVLILQPLRGIGAISSEVKGNTLDMMVLTRLSAGRIVAGKWFALVSQSALIFATVIPYLIFRYFLGQMNLVSEVVILILLFLASMTVTAVTVGLSASSSVILRVLVPIVAVPFFGWLALFLAFGGSNLADFLTLSTTESRLGVGALVIAFAYLGWSMLSMGTSIIAPSAENHATLRRVVTLIITIAASACIVFIDSLDRDLTGAIFGFIAAPAFATALTERSFVAPSVKARFAKWGAAGNFARLFLSPGWPSGVLFTVLLSVIFTTVVFIDPMMEREQQVQTMAVIGTLLFPAVVVTLLRTEEAGRISSYLLLLIGTMIFMLVILSIAQSLNNNDLLWFFIWLPFTFIPLEDMMSSYPEHILDASCVVAGIYAAILLTAAFVTARSETPANPPDETH